MVHGGSGAIVRALRALILGGGLALAGNACVCTLEDCSNAAYVDIVHDGAWQDGSYTLELSLDGEERSCDFVLPDDLPATGHLAALDCGDDGDGGEDVSALLGRRTKCTSTSSADGNSSSGSCTPIPDEYEISLELAANPKSVSITLTRDGATVLSDSRAPKYGRIYPNGSDCDEGCAQASYELSFED